MINQLKIQIENNINKMNDMLDLMSIYQDEELDKLYEEYDKLFNETLELSEKIN